MSKIITGWDPGDTTGYAVWTDEGVMVEMGQCLMEDIPVTWDHIRSEHGPIHVAVIEDFVLFGKRAVSQTGSRMKASQGIGMLKALAQIDNTVVAIQPANVKDSGKKWFSVVIPSDHSESHKWDAYIHGMVWMKNQGIVQTTLEKKMGV